MEVERSISISILKIEESAYSTYTAPSGFRFAMKMEEEPPLPPPSENSSLSKLNFKKIELAALSPAKVS